MNWPPVPRTRNGWRGLRTWQTLNEGKPRKLAKDQKRDSSKDQQLFRGEPTFSIMFLLIILCVCIARFCVSSSWGTLFALYSLGSACDHPYFVVPGFTDI